MYKKFKCIMDWKLYLFWVTLISTSSLSFSQHDIPTVSHSNQYAQTTDTIPDQYGHDRKRPERAERPAQRMSERSIPLDSGIRRIQDVERSRLGPKEDRVPRIENGTYKVINNLSAVTLASRKGSGNEQRKLQDIVVFPGPTSKSVFVPNIPEECRRRGICEDLPDYPEERVAKIIDNLGDAKDRYMVDELDPPEIAQRIGPPEEMELCDFSRKVVIPKAAEDQDGNWHYILNQKDKPFQGFQVEICREDQSPCAKLIHIYSGYEASCKQKYVLRYMAGLDQSGEMIEKKFKLPSCCSCIVRQTD